MKMNEILHTIRLLSESQGFYGRLYNAITVLKEQDPDQYRILVQDLEAQHFADMLDLVDYFEGDRE